MVKSDALAVEKYKKNTKKIMAHSTRSRVKKCCQALINFASVLDDLNCALLLCVHGLLRTRFACPLASEWALCHNRTMREQVWHLSGSLAWREAML